MVSDDPGLAMLLNHRDRYFPTQPIVFLGINHVQPRLFKQPRLTGVFETRDRVETAAEALRQNGYGGLIVLSDTSETGLAETQKVRQVLDLPTPPKQLVILEDLTAKTLPVEMAKYPNHWPVLIVGQLRQGHADGPLVITNETNRVARETLPNPLYGPIIRLPIGEGVVGGKMLDAKQHGIEATEIAMAILAGTAVEDIPPVTKSKNIWFFDEQELKRFSINLDDFPEGSYIINIKRSFYEQHWRLVWLTATGFGITLLVIALLIEVIRRRAIAAQLLTENQARYKDLAEAGANMFWELDTQMRFTYISGDAQSLHGLHPEAFLGQTPDKLLAPYPRIKFDFASFQEQFQARSVINDFQFRVKEGARGLRIFKLNGKPIFKKGVFVGYRGIKREITEKYQLAEELAYQATYDSLTGLFNRQTFDQILQQTVERVQKTELQATLCYLDLDQFKLINDTAGHLVGDRLLGEITQILRRSIPASAALGRLGGDEFGLILKDCSLSEAENICETLICKVQAHRFRWIERKFRVGMSIGLIPIESTSSDSVELLSQADLACYRAKALGREQLYVSPPGDTTLATQKVQLGHLATLTQALEEDRFFLMQQPIIALSTLNQSAGLEPPDTASAPHFEVLLRLRDETGNTIAPGLFIPEAERYGLITQVDRWVLKKVLTALARLNLPNESLVSINLSGASLSNENFLKDVVEMIQHATSGLHSPPVHPEWICFEITETAAISHLETVKAFIYQLKDLGLKFALDDFGSGLSSLGYLRELPVDFLKIDGSLVKNIHQDKTDLAIVSLINKLAHMMKMETIAEFVENDSIRQCLYEIGVDYGQGYGLGKPVAFDVFDGTP
ncbi:MAG: EAL domain-containing protein [Phormidesmis sp.]